MGQMKENMDLAWEVARRLINLTTKEREKIFGYSDIGAIIKNNSVTMVNGMIMDYEKKLEEEKIGIGDIVRCNFLEDGVVSSAEYDEEGELIFSVIFEDGTFNTFSRDELTKTGKSVDVLKTLRELILG